MRRALSCAAIGFAAFASGCSRGEGDGPVTLTQAQIDTQALGAFLNPDDPLGSIPSTLKGVSTWVFYSSALGTITIGEDANSDPVAEVALLIDERGNDVGAAYAMASDLGVTGSALARAVNADLQTVVTSTGQQGVKVLGGLTGDGGTLTTGPMSLVAGCATALVNAFAAGVGGALGHAPSMPCPDNIGTNCVAGAAAGGTSGSSAILPACSITKGVVDNAAIVEVTTMMLAATPVSGILDSYNHEDPFAIKSSAYSSTFSQRLTGFDNYDGTTDWQPGQAAAWVSRVASGNYLVVDTSMPCDFANPHTYLELERAQLTGNNHATCGGRMPNENAIDVTVNYLIRGPGASPADTNAYHEGVAQATKLSTSSFPYLAEMN